MRKLAPLLLAALLLGACTGEKGSVAESAPAGTNRPTETSAAADVPEEEPTEQPTSEAPPAPTNPTFGQTFTWEAGLSITVGVPTVFEPSEFSANEDAAAYLKFDVTIVNGTDANFEPGVVYITAASANTEASNVFDSEQNIGISPSTTLLPGREVAYSIAFGVADPADIVMEVTPGFEYEPVIFTT